MSIILSRYLRSSLAVLLGLVLAALLPLHTAVAAGSVYSWEAASSLGTKYWSALAMSGDGSTMLAGGFGSPNDPQSYLYLSTDRGATWSQTANNEHGSWNGAAVSSDGSTLVGVEYSASDYGPGNVYISHDHGASWTIASALAPGYWNSVAVSANGSVISAVQGRTSSDDKGLIYTSTDGGATWSAAPHAAQWHNVAISGDGSTIIAAPKYDPDYGTDYLYLSTDGGATWSPVMTVGTFADAYWAGVALSSDGQTIAAANMREHGFTTGHVYVSHDRGTSWTQADAPTGLYNDVGMSDDGQIILAAQENDVSGSNPGTAELSTDEGATWSQVPISPNQNFNRAVVSRDGSTLGLAAETDGGASGTYGSVYLGKLLPPPAQPVPDPIHAGDTTLTGTTTPSATVTAHFAGDLTASAIANSFGKFSIRVPASISLTNHDIIRFSAISPEGISSTTVERTVVASSPSTPTAPSSPSKPSPVAHPARLASTGAALWHYLVFGFCATTLGVVAMSYFVRRARRLT